MKLNINLGVPTEALLKHPTACFNLSKAATRVSAALSFGEFYLKQTKGDVVVPRDLEHMSAALYSSSRSADELAFMLADDPELKKAVQAYSKSALRFNTQLRRNLPSVTAIKAKVVAKAKGEKLDVKPVTVAQMDTRTTDLRKQLAEIEKKVENLCTVDKPAAKIVTPTTMKGRAGMAGGNGAKKRPLYPRYFVASMGRSRR
jgi:hypothetical protein